MKLQGLVLATILERLQKDVTARRRGEDWKPDYGCAGNKVSDVALEDVVAATHRGLSKWRSPASVTRKRSVPKCNLGTRGWREAFPSTTWEREALGTRGWDRGRGRERRTRRSRYPQSSILHPRFRYSNPLFPHARNASQSDAGRSVISCEKSLIILRDRRLRRGRCRCHRPFRRVTRCKDPAAASRLRPPRACWSAPGRPR